MSKSPFTSWPRTNSWADCRHPTPVCRDMTNISPPEPISLRGKHGIKELEGTRQGCPLRCTFPDVQQSSLTAEARVHSSPLRLVSTTRMWIPASRNPPLPKDRALPRRSKPLTPTRISRVVSGVRQSPRGQPSHPYPSEASTPGGTRPSLRPHPTPWRRATDRPLYPAGL